MEVGEHLTNVLLINDFSSIQYYYLEYCFSTTKFEQPSLLDIEASLRASGALVVTCQPGLWVFWRSGDTRPVLPSKLKFRSPGVVEFDNHELAIKEEGTYEPSKFWRSLRSPTTSTPSPAFPTDSSIRNAQALNIKAVASNVTPGSSKENGFASSAIKSGPPVGEPTSSDRDIQEYFTSAVLATLSYHLCNSNGFMALNARTFLVSLPGGLSGDEKRIAEFARSQHTSQRICLVTLDVHLSSLGTLILKAWPDEPCKFDSLPIAKDEINSDISSIEDATVFLAPSGKIGRYAGPVLNEAFISAAENFGSAGEQTAARSSVLGEPMGNWKQRCINWLEQKGIVLEEPGLGHWVLIQILARVRSIDSIDGDGEGLWTPGERVITVAWPASLCFQRTTSGVIDTSSLGVGHDYDPLSFAEEWFTANTSREAIIAKRQKERDSAAAAVKAQTECDAKYLAPTSYSPMALRRASIAGAVYPTPPDGIQPNVGATPSFDDSISTPGQPIPQSVPAEAENLNVPKTDTEEVESSLWDTNGVKKDQPSAGLEFNDGGNDNIFVNMGGDLFGEDDITDADFNFFDGPDNLVEMQEDSQENDVNMLEDTHKLGHTVEAGVQRDSSNDEVTSGAGIDVVMGDAGVDETMATQQNLATPVHTGQPQVDLNHDESSLQMAVLKISSPPLSPELVFKRLSIAAGDHLRGSKEGSLLTRTVSAFRGVEFDPSFSSFSEKYGSHGRFIYPPSSSIPPSTALTGIPMTDYLSKRLKRNPAPFNLLNQISVLPEDQLLPELENNDSQSDVESQGYSHIASPISDQDDASIATEDGPPVLMPTLKRKRGFEGGASDDGMPPSLQDLKAGPENHLRVSEPQELFDLTLFDPDTAEWSLATFLSTPEPCTSPSSFTDEQYVASAQVLADQAISRTLSLPLLTNADWAGCSLEQRTDIGTISTLVQQNLAKAASLSFDQVDECRMATFVETQDLQAASQLSRLPSRPMPHPRGIQNSDTTKPTAIFSLPPPHLEVRRAESKLTVLPPAIAFWESLGLAPCNSGKDVSSICVYPDAVGMPDNVNAFLDHMRSAYESNRLGSHERFSAGDLENGHMAIDLGDSAPISVADHQAILLKIKDTSTRLGTILSAGATIETNIVVYYVYDSKRPELILPICSAFHDLFDVYKDLLKEQKLAVLNELVLQLIPLDFVASQTSLVVSPPSEYARIALEVYDRCIDLQTGTSIPSIVLEQPLPKTIDFKQTTNPSASPLQDNSCIHIAYAQSLDDRWVTASWTDNIGTQQMTASYCLGRRDVPLATSFLTVAKEIWETTLELIANRKISWRFMIAKCGVMEPPEIEFWKDLAAKANDPTVQVTLTLITVDTNPSLKLLPPLISISPATLAAQAFYTTPVSTPSASIVSPEQSGNALTPAREPGVANAPTPTDSNTELKVDADAILVDITDQSWGVILSHRLNNSRSLLEFNPTLVSGYLIKRSGTAPSDAPIVTEVNIVHSDLTSRMHEALLREILGYYRGLATLARVRGVVDPVKDGRPWHVAAAEKAVRVLYMLM